MIQILIFDNQEMERAKALARTLETTMVSVTVLHDGAYYDPAGQERQPLGHADLVFFHQGDWDAFRQSSHSDTRSVSYSGGGGVDIPRQVHEEGFSQGEAEHIRSELAKEELLDLKERILGFWRRGAEKHALRLLCEAWLANDGLSEKEHGDAKVIVHAPTEMQHWHAPFQALVDEGKASKVTGLFGDAEVEATAVFRSVAEGSECRDAVRTLVRKLSDGTKGA